jgi:hypothetical protein
VARLCRKRVHDLDIRVTAKPDVTAINPADAVLPHQGDQMRVGYVISARLVAARGAEQFPKTIRLAWRADMWSPEKRIGIGARFADVQRLGKDCRVGDDAQVAKA